MKKELRDYIENATIGKVDIQQCQYGSVIVFTIKDENDESTIDELYDEIGNYVCISICHGDNYVFSNKKQVAYHNVIDYIYEPEQMSEYLDDLKKQQDDFIVITNNVSKFADSLIKKYEEEYEDVYDDAFQMWIENIEFSLYREGISKEYVKMLYNYIYSN